MSGYFISMRKKNEGGEPAGVTMALALRTSFYCYVGSADITKPLNAAKRIGVPRGIEEL